MVLSFRLMAANHININQMTYKSDVKGAFIGFFTFQEALVPNYSIIQNAAFQ